MRVKLDENIDASLGVLLAGVSDDVSSVVAQHLSGRSDEVIHAVCVAEGRVLITLDLDFSNPLRFPCADTPGIVILRPHRTTLPQVRALITQIADALSRETPSNALWIAEPGRVRIHQAEMDEKT
jgi:predicted nuclease of predicted toxin-antitoxin system